MQKSQIQARSQIRNRTAVQLGRFAPYHIGHQLVTKMMIDRHGIENCLILVGSSNSLNQRTPFTFEQRTQMIHAIYPELKVLPMPDVKPQLIEFDGSSNKVWLSQILKLEEELNADFVFYGGSEADLEVLSMTFDTEVITDRNTNGLDLSATAVRKVIAAGDQEQLRKLLGKEITEISLAAIQENGISL